MSLSDAVSPAYRIEREWDLCEGLSQIVRGHLFIPDENVSQVQQFYDSDWTPDGRHTQSQAHVDAIWLAFRSDTEAPVGMALVAFEHGPVMDEANEEWGPLYPILNMYVDPEHAGQGLGTQLAALARQHYPTLMGHYTRDSIAIYESQGIDDIRLTVAAGDPRSLEHVLNTHAAIHRDRWRNKGASCAQHDRPHHGRPSYTTPPPAPEQTPLQALRRQRLR